MLSQDEIDSLLTTFSAPGNTAARLASSMGTSEEAGSVDTIQQLLEAEKQKNYKLYNFRRPDKFSKDHLRALQSIHENYARQFALLLTAYLRMNVEIEVVSVDQLTYDEFARSMPRPITVGILEFPPLPGQLLMGIGFEVTMSMIDRMLGGLGSNEGKARELTDIESSLITQIIRRSNHCMEDAWRNMLDVSINLIGLEESYTLIQVATPGEIVALVTFEIMLGNQDSGLMSLCIPYPVVEQVIDQLSSQHIFHKAQTESDAQPDVILERMRYATVPTSVLLGGTQLPIKELMDLTVGDVIKIDRMAKSELLMCVNEQPKFFCRPGTKRGNLAVCVSSSVEEIEAVEGFGLADPSEWAGNGVDSLL